MGQRGAFSVCVPATTVTPPRGHDCAPRPPAAISVGGFANCWTCASVKEISGGSYLSWLLLAVEVLVVW